MPGRFQAARTAIQAAPNRAAVLGALRECIAAVSPAEIAEFPASCRPIFLEPGFDIEEAAYTLINCELAFKGTPELRTLLREVAYTFAAASVRLVQLNHLA